MQIYFDRLPKRVLGLIHLAKEVARKHSYSLYLVGGFVRGLILGVPNLDLDITVEGDALNFATQLSHRLNGRLIRHRRFGTATVIAPDRIKIDVATARKESYESPGSLPVVEPGSIKDDLRRRDFTINAIAIRIYPRDIAGQMDFFNGRNDIRDKKIRVLHDLSFIDDPTRILRAIRFEQRYNFRIEKHTLRLLKKAVCLNMLNEVNPHRLKDEIVLILKEDCPIKYIKRIKELIGFSFITSKLCLHKKNIAFLNCIYRSISWFKQEVPGRRILDSWLMYFIGLSGDLKKRDLIAICNKFAFSRGETKRAVSYKTIIDSLEKRLRKKLSASSLYRLLEPLSYEVILLIKAKSKNKIVHKNIKDFLEIYNGTRLHVTGNDLLQLGVPIGPDYKKILNRTLYARLDKKINTKEEEIEFIKRLIKR